MPAAASSDHGDAVRTSALRVRDELRTAILGGSISPGSRLRAGAVAERYDTSRTPVRDAFMLLAREGLVDLQPRRGAVVRPFDTDDVLELYALRCLLEPEAARRAALRCGPTDVGRLAALCEASESCTGTDDRAVTTLMDLNDQIHALVVAAAGSPRLEAALRSVGSVPLAFRTVFWRDDDQRQQSLLCHRQLLGALAGASADLAGAAMSTHLYGAVAFLRSQEQRAGPLATEPA